VGRDTKAPQTQESWDARRTGLIVRFPASVILLSRVPLDQVFDKIHKYVNNLIANGALIGHWILSDKNKRNWGRAPGIDKRRIEMNTGAPDLRNRQANLNFLVFRAGGTLVRRTD
jgi:hypothetical protein